MKSTTADAIDGLAERVSECLISPNVADANMEHANVVDVLHQIAVAINRLAKAAEKIGLSRGVDNAN